MLCNLLVRNSRMPVIWNAQRIKTPREEFNLFIPIYIANIRESLRDYTKYIKVRISVTARSRGHMYVLANHGIIMHRFSSTL